MKKIIILLAANILSVSLFATDDDHPVAVAKSASNISKQAISSFNREFKNAKAVSWETASDLYFAYFMLGQEQLVASFDETGNHISTGRYIEFTDLPLAVSLAIKNKYPKYTEAGRVAEVVINDNTSYHFTLISDKQVLRIKASAEGDLSVTAKQKLLKQ